MTDYFTQGNQLLEAGQIRKAIISFQKAIEFNPTSPWPYYHLGLALDKDGQLEGAVSELGRAIALDPDLIWAHHYLGETLVKLGRLEKAVGEFQRAIEVKPDLSWSYYHLGEALCQLRRWDEAVINLRRAIELKPDFCWSYHYLGEALSQLQKWDEAAAALSQAVTLHEHFGSYSALGQCLNKLGELEKAIYAYRQAIKLNPDAEQIHFSLAETLQQQAKLDLEQAALAYRRAIELNPQQIESYQKLVEIDPENGDCWLSLGKVLEKKGDVDSAVKAYRRACELKPENAEIYQQLGKLLVKLNQLEEAIASYRRAVEITPSSGHYYHLLGLALTKIGQEEEALATFRRAGELLEQQGKIGLAIDAYQEMLRLASNADISFKLGMLCAQCGQFLKALIQYQEGLQSQSASPENYAKLALILVQQGLGKDVFNTYHKLNLTNELFNSYHEIVSLLYQKGLAGEAVKCFQQPPGAKSSGKWKIYQDLWDDLNQKDISTVEDWRYPTELQLEEVAECFANNSNYKVMTLDSLSESDKNYLENNGFYMLYLALLRHQNFSLEQILIKSFDDSPEILNDKLNITGYHFFNYSYEQSLVETGYIYAFCPLSGKVLRSNQSFVINHRDLDGKQHFDLQGFCYRFVGEEVFYLMTGHSFGYILLIYFPKMELIINLNAYHLTDFSYRPVENMNKLKSYMVTCWQEVKSYILSPERKQIVDVIGLGFNMGHYFWQDLGGIHVLHKNGILHKLDKILVGPGDYLSAKDVFPEVPSEKFAEVEDVWQVFKTVVANNYVALRVNGNFIEEDLANKVHQGGIKQSSENFLQEVEKAKKYSPLILIWIRSHYRLWLSQAEGISNIINKLSDEFPNLGIIFDGWGSKRSYDESTAIEIESVNETIHKILPLITRDIYIYNSNGSMNYEKAVWSRYIDCYIAAAGSGLTFPIWIGGKPGVVYGTNYSRETFARCEFSAAVRENAVDAIPLLPDVFDSNGWISEYDMDWHRIYDEVVKIIRGISR